MTTWRAGQTREVVVVEDLKRTQIVQYAGASGDYNPLHTDEPYAREVAGYPTVFAHGMLTMAMTGRAIAEMVGVESWASFGGRFTAQVWPGDTLTVYATVNSIDQGVACFDLRTQNQDGHDVFQGYASARV